MNNGRRVIESPTYQDANRGILFYHSYPPALKDALAAAGLT